jgi:hypothetical protein
MVAVLCWATADPAGRAVAVAAVGVVEVAGRDPGGNGVER